MIQISKNVVFPAVYFRAALLDYLPPTESELYSSHMYMGSILYFSIYSNAMIELMCIL